MELLAKIIVGIVAVGMLLMFFARRLLRQTQPEREMIDRPKSWLQMWPFITLPAFGVLALLAIADIANLPYTGVWVEVVRGLGLLLLIAGVMLTLWARKSLGKQLIPDVAVTQEHELIQTGAYAICRHPLYLGFLAIWLGAGLAMLNLLLLLTFLIVATIQTRRAKLEEELLLKHFGMAYEVYRRKVPRLFPLRLRRPR